MKPLKGPIIEFSCHIMAKNMEKSIRKLLPAAEYKKCEKKQVEIPLEIGTCHELAQTPMYIHAQ